MQKLTPGNIVFPDPGNLRPHLVKRSATFSPCRRYRYALWRTWDAARPGVLFIGLNPSTADEVADDPTIRRCMGYARSWGYGGVCVANLFAWRATKPADLRAAEDPVGADNDAWLARLADGASLVVAAWGNHGAWLGRSREVAEMLPDLHCLQRNRSGEPTHPLYLRRGLRPMPLTKGVAKKLP